MLVMGDAAKKKTSRLDSIQCHKRVDSIRYEKLYVYVYTCV